MTGNDAVTRITADSRFAEDADRGCVSRLCRQDGEAQKAGRAGSRANFKLTGSSEERGELR